LGHFSTFFCSAFALSASLSLAKLNVLSFNALLRCVSDA
jgi:hypothetical protein